MGTISIFLRRKTDFFIDNKLSKAVLHITVYNAILSVFDTVIIHNIKT